MTTSVRTADVLPAGAANVLECALDVIIADVDAWDQSVYGRRAECGTAYCLAGHVAVTVLGYAPVWTGGTGVKNMYDVEVPEDDARGYDGRRSVDDVAAEHLGLAEPDGLASDRALTLFDGGRSLRRLVELAYAFTGGAVDRFAAYDDLVRERPEVAARDRGTEAREARRVDADVAEAYRGHGGETWDETEWTEWLD